MSFKDALTKLHLVEDDAPITPSVTTPAPAAVATAAPTSFTSVPTALADPDMVAKIKTSVLGTSPIINQFMQNLEIVRPQFPNDDSACMKAALAFTRVDKNTLIGELNRTVAAALLHTKNALENEHKKAHDAAVGPLEQQLSSITADITSANAQIAELQQQVITKQATSVEIQGKIRDAEANVQQQDAVVKGSLSQVEQYIATLGATFAKL